MSDNKISIRIESQKDSTLIQTNIFEALRHLSDLSRKQNRMKIHTKVQCSSPLVIEISDESGSENEVISAKTRMSVKRKLAFTLSDDSEDSSDELPSKARHSPGRNVREEMVLNKPTVCSTPVEPPVTSSIHKEAMTDDSDACSTPVEPPVTSSIDKEAMTDDSDACSTPVEPPVTSSIDKEAMTDDSDATIILENSYEMPRISIGQNIVITPAKTTSSRIWVRNNLSTSCGSENTGTGSKNGSPKIDDSPKIDKEKESFCSNEQHTEIKCKSDLSSGKGKYQGQSKSSSSSNASTHSPIKVSSARNQGTPISVGAIHAVSNESDTNSNIDPNDVNTSASPSIPQTPTKPNKSTSSSIKGKCSSEISPERNDANRSENVSAPSTSIYQTPQKNKPNKLPGKPNESTSPSSKGKGLSEISRERNDANQSKNVSAPSTSIYQTPHKNKLNKLPGKPNESTSPSSKGKRSSEISPERNDANRYKNVSAPSTSIYQTPQKNMFNKLPGKSNDSTSPSIKGKGSSEISPERNGANRYKNVSAPSTSIYQTPKKNKLNKSPGSSPIKRLKTPSPKKERQMNLGYLKVFEEMFSSVSEAPHLRNLIVEEMPLLRMITTSDPKYFYVILKLFIWLPKRYNIFKFCEKILVGMEDKEVVTLYTSLQENGIVDVDFRKEDVCALLNDLDLASVKRICEKFKLKKTLSGKNAMINTLSTFCRTQSTLTLSKSAKDLILDEIMLEMGKCVKLKDSVREAFYKAFLLGTFTNPSLSDVQDFFRIMMVTKPAFPEYRIEDHVIFYSREEFRGYATARSLRDGLEEAQRNHNHILVFQISETVFSALKELGNNNGNDDGRYRDVPHLKRFTAQSVYLNVLTKSCEDLRTKYPEKVKVWLEFLIKTFPLSHRSGEWYLQLTWLYMRYIKPVDYVHSAKLLIEILQEKRDSLSDVQLQKLRERGEQLKVGKKYNKINQHYHDIIAELIPEPIKLEDFPQSSVDSRAIRSEELGKKRKYLVHDSDGARKYLSVENVALEYYTERCGYTDGVHCEGSLIKATFTLFFWDLIYFPEILVPATFLSKYQEVPLDLMTSYFYTNRKDAIDKRLCDIYSEWSDSKLMEFVKHNYEMHSHEKGLCEPGRYVKDAEMLETLVNCIGRKVLSKIYERLVKNIREYSSGMPDLLMWNIEEKKSKFVEVKGESDRLSVKQKLWLKYLESVGAHIEVCLVHSMGSKRKNKIKSVTASNTENTLTPPSTPEKKKKIGSKTKICPTPNKKSRLHRERARVSRTPIDNTDSES